MASTVVATSLKTWSRREEFPNVVGPGKDSEMVFGGFGRDALAFYAGLEADNSKTYWNLNKPVYESAVGEPMKAFATSVAEEFGTLVVFRPHRDVRFAKDKSPYKTHTGAVTELEGGAMVYVQLSSKGLMAASGYYMMASDQLERFRASVADDKTGPALEAAIAAVRAAKLHVSHGGSEPLKTAPRGYPKDHPRIALLRWKGVIGSKDFGAPSWLHTKACVGHVEKAWRDTRPIRAWLDRHVGPSMLMPEEAR